MKTDIIRKMNRKSTMLIPGSLFPVQDALVFKHSSFLGHQPKPPVSPSAARPDGPIPVLCVVEMLIPFLFPLVSLLPKPFYHQKPRTPLISSPPLLMVSDIILYDHACYSRVEAFLFHGTTAFFCGDSKGLL